MTTIEILKKLPDAKPSGKEWTAKCPAHEDHNGVRATAKVNDSPPSFEVNWHSEPNRKLLSEYLQWRESFLTDFRERTGKKILVVNLA